MNNKDIMANCILMTALVALVLCVFVPRAFGIFFPQDEFGYWNNAAGMVGIDWSDVAAGQDRYAIGYSILLLPLIKLPLDPILRYRIALVINGVLAVIYAGVFSTLVGRLYPKMNWKERLAISMPCICYPCCLLYLHYSTAEVFLNVLFVILCCFMTDSAKRNLSATYEFTGLICAVALFLTHYRMIGVVAAFIIIRSVIWIRNKGLQGRLLLTVTAALTGIVLTAGIILCIYLGFFSVKALFDTKTILRIAVGIFGKIYYIAVVSFGLGLAGLISVAGMIRCRFNMFILSAVGITVFISTYFFRDDNRLDQLVYGRYIEMFIPVLMAIGINRVIILKDKLNVKWMLAIGAIAIMLTVYAHMEGLTEYLPNYVSGIDWMFGDSLPTTTSIFFVPFVVAMSGYLLIEVVIKRNITIWAAAVSISMIFLFCSFFLTEKHIYRYQDLDRSDYELEQRMEELCMKKGEESIMFLNSPYMNYINLIQFWMYDKKIELITEDEFDRLNIPIVLTYSNYDRPDKLMEYTNREDSVHFFLYYNNQ